MVPHSTTPIPKWLLLRMSVAALKPPKTSMTTFSTGTLTSSKVDSGRVGALDPRLVFWRLVA